MKKVKSLKTLIRFCQRNGIWSFSPLPHLENHVMRWKLMYGPDRRRYVSCGVCLPPGRRESRVSSLMAGSLGGVREHIEMMYGAQRAPGTKIEMPQTK